MGDSAWYKTRLAYVVHLQSSAEANSYMTTLKEDPLKIQFSEEKPGMGAKSNAAGLRQACHRLLPPPT